MNKKNFLIGMGMGLTVGGVIAMATRPKKRCMKSAVGKTLKTMGEVADSISDSLGWEREKAKKPDFFSKNHLQFYLSCANISRLQEMRR